ncbi:hypothetical protein N7509_010615 [Penicillium cosmopolitanum]|uniref:CBM21 domain-containing protein n=1 Tax=Penicillium cosmopolitanum TaxID=1131564 RepID=A0A9W9VRS7_9EURO|nr:uncharacterized protein N7509_010615 [Penicillium cosmopolitanum]KAJ5388074.1 hypothetical protein N7509_010615 [Penicillium cosmopolitanum]
MPYTAPLKSLLSAQHIEYSDPSQDTRPERPGLARSASARVQNSRNYSSTSYVRRHRRSPSIGNKSAVHSFSEPASRLSPVIDPHASLRQSPPPLTNAAIPPGAVISPPESTQNSDEESSPVGDIKLEELEAAVRSIEQRRESSPEREPKRMGPADQLGTEARSSSSQPTTRTENKPLKPNLIRLSKEARKIAHSRSSTETAIDYKREEALTSSPDDSDADLSPKPPMVRKKSGELVRPALRPATARRRPSSMPGTPVFAKAVHFDSQLEHIRHFLQLDRPLAVSAETSPVDDHDGEDEFPFGNRSNKGASSWEWELQLSNFPKNPSSRSTNPVRLERLFLSADKTTLIGSVAVANLDFHKNVAARFTFDSWRTVSEVSATYCHDVHHTYGNDGYDRFTFDIKLDDQAKLESKTMHVCMRYNVAGQEYWDNNCGMNYRVDFLKTQKPMASAHPSNTRTSSGARPALPRSRSFTGLHTRPHSMPSSSFDESITPVEPGFIKRHRHRSSPKRREKPSQQAFGNRYDFGASLTAAMKTKPPVDRTTLTARARWGQTSDAPRRSSTVEEPETGSSQKPAVSDHAQKDVPKPSSLVSSKPCLESSVYKELVDKYCFYGTPKSSPPKPQSFSVNVNGEAASKYFSTGSPSPPLSPRSPAPLEPAAVEAPRESRSGSSSSPAVSPRSSPRVSPSSLSFRFPYNSLQNGFMKDPQSSPVIRG